MPVISPLHDAELYLETWVHAVSMQRQRLAQHQRPQASADRRLFAHQLSDWLLARNADALLMVLALDQVGDIAKALHRAAPPEAQTRIAVAVEHFHRACGDLRATRNAVVHMRDYLHGEGGSKRDESSEYAFPDFPDTFVILVERGATDSLLEIDFDDGTHAAERLLQEVRKILRDRGKVYV